jgi:hypothetical protein
MGDYIMRPVTDLHRFAEIVKSMPSPNVSYGVYGSKLQALALNNGGVCMYYMTLHRNQEQAFKAILAGYL